MTSDDRTMQGSVSRRVAIKGAASVLCGAALGGAVAQAAGTEAAAVPADLARVRTYVLVHGAWFGGWVWRDVAPRLRALGHRVSTPTLTGLGERRHLAGDGYDLDTHIQDVVAHIEMEDLRQIDLVGWSYGGMVVTGVLARVADRIRSVIYLDAFVPANGKSLADYAEPSVLPAIEDARARNGTFAPIPLDVMGLSEPTLVAFAQPRLTPQFWRSCMSPVTAIPRPNIPFTYIRCSAFNNPAFDAFYREMRAAGHDTHEMASGHVPMLDHAEETTTLLAQAR